MFKYILVIAVFSVMGYMETMPLIRQKQIKSLLLYSGIFLPALILTFLLGMNIQVPSPAPLMEKLLKMAIKFCSSLLPPQYK